MFAKLPKMMLLRIDCMNSESPNQSLLKLAHPNISKYATIFIKNWKTKQPVVYRKYASATLTMSEKLIWTSTSYSANTLKNQ